LTTQPRDPALLLKSIAPKVGPGFLERERLKLDQLLRAGPQVIPVLAPTGYGKTSQLASWRREALARGAVTVWFTADGRDDPLRLVLGLALAAQAVCGKRSFSEQFMQRIIRSSDPQEAMTGLLGELAELAKDVWLFLDDVDLLPTSARSQVLEYMLGNLPANVHVALAARPTAALRAGGTLSTAPAARALASDLRFTVAETLGVLSSVMGKPCPPDTAVRLHELAEGWPLGIRLGAVALHRGRELPSLLSDASADIRRYFLDAVLDRQPVETIDMLVRLSAFETIHPGLCAAVLGSDSLVQELVRLCDESPLMTRAEEGDWVRMHPLAREALRERWGTLPLAERSAIARKASRWYAEFGLHESAAEQSLLAGDADAALDLVERHSQQMTIQGRGATVFAWYQRLSQKEIRQHPGLWASAAWALATSDRNAEAQGLIDLILARPDLTVALRFEAVLIAASAAGFSDRYDKLSKLFSAWNAPPAESRPADVGVYYVGRGLQALYGGQPEQARRFWKLVPDIGPSEAYSPVSHGYAGYGIGLSYCWEGRYELALDVLQPALSQCEDQMGRYNPMSCMLAAVLAHACLECDRTDEVRSMLAGRMEVLVHFGLPEALMLAYCTLAQQAELDGRQDQALSLLDSLQATGEARGILRMQIAAQYELVQLHARQRRADAAQRHSERLSALLRAHSTLLYEPTRHWASLHVELAHATCALARAGASQCAEAWQALEAAASHAEAILRGAESVKILMLRAEVLRRRGAQAEAHAAQTEAISLANANGMARILRECAGASGNAAYAPPSTGTKVAADVNRTMSPAVHAAGMLTQKESEVLALLSRNLSNKEIALAMSIGEQTVKWHLKNLFNKLNAGTRKHLVARARLLGLVEG
jgi:LuxR family transcriptional regulator, maltose regulon positive regulatory protein